MEQELIKLLEEIDTTSRQLAHTFIREIAHKDMDSHQWYLLMEGIKHINAASQKAFFNADALRRSQDPA